MSLFTWFLLNMLSFILHVIQRVYFKTVEAKYETYIVKNEERELCL